jgi:aspartyl-tRNA(Asn)/glutamyl-tRNA(Gln) amidotransferase subunit A
MELTACSIGEAAELIAGGQLSAVELTRAYLERIESINPQLNCFITLTAEEAMRQARSAEQEIANGKRRGALHGIPLAFKDLYETKGVRTTAGSSFFTDYVPNANGTAIAKLNEAGAVCLGKLNMHEVALGVSNDNPHFGACKNPWALERIPGGSSGGSGAALAADLCAGSLGSDTGGSIRIPASLCGIAGLKPTYGRVSVRGVIPLSWNLDHAGPMARRVRDLALLLQAIAGYDDDDPYSVNMPADDFCGRIGDGVKGWRVAVAGGYFAEADAAVVEAVGLAGGIFAQLGAQVRAVELDGAREAAGANPVMSMSDAATFHRARLSEHPEKFGADVLKRLRMGETFSSRDYAVARHTQTRMRRRFAQFFGEHDLLLTPATPTVAMRREGLDAVEAAGILTRFTAPFNLTGLPALSLPCGFTEAGLPIGLQIVGPPWAEAQVLRAGHTYEQATEWWKRKPKGLPGR